MPSVEKELTTWVVTMAQSDGFYSGKLSWSVLTRVHIWTVSGWSQ